MRDRSSFMIALTAATLACSQPSPRTTRVEPIAPADAPDADTRTFEPTFYTCDHYDPKNPGCRDACPPIGTADCKCPSPPDVNLVACQNVMACPDPPDRRVHACWSHTPYPSDGAVLSRILQVEPQPPGSLIWISAGTNQGIDEHWHGAILDGDSDQPLPRGELTIVWVGKGTTRATVGLPPDVVVKTSRVRLVHE